MMNQPLNKSAYKTCLDGDGVGTGDALAIDAPLVEGCCEFDSGGIS
jgi:hypothetical protein